MKLWRALGMVCLWLGSSTSAHCDSPTLELVAYAVDDPAAMSAGTPIELAVSRWPTTEEGTLAVVLGDSDRTDLFNRTATTLVYRPDLAPLPHGQYTISVYLVSPDGDWQLLFEHPVQVPGPGGFIETHWAPRLEVGIKGQLAESHAPAENAPARSRFRDATLQLSFDGRAVRPGFELEPSLQVIGVTFGEEALRFSTEGPEAPRVDLASYVIRAGLGNRLLQLGHVSFGQHRHLIQGFSSRGLSFSTPLGNRSTLELAAVNGSQVVGWDNLLGLEERRHRLVTGTLGLELAPRSGALRVETSFLHGRVLPQSGFNQAAVNDAEEQSGFGLRLESTTLSQRLRIECGFARSRFDNPTDPLLFQGSDVVPVATEERDARYVDLSTLLLRRSLSPILQAAVTLALRHSRVDPLFRTIGSSVQSDREENAADLTVTLGAATLQLGYGAFEDNLDRIASLTTTRNRREAVSLLLPMREMWSGPDGAPVWLPQLTYVLERNHQFGLGIPPGSGLVENQIPDQVSENQDLGLDWQLRRMHFGVRVGESSQDNRQSGRESADFVTRTQTVSLRGPILEGLDLGLDLSSERSLGLEEGRIETQRRAGLNLSWLILPRLTWTSIVSRTHREARDGSSEADDWGSDLQLAWSFERQAEGRGARGQIFLRWSDQRSDSLDRTFGFASELASRTLNAGLNLSLF